MQRRNSLLLELAFQDFADQRRVCLALAELHYLALSKALKNFNINLTLEEHSATYDGLPTYKKVEMLAEKHSLSACFFLFGKPIFCANTNPGHRREYQGADRSKCQ